MKRLSLSFFFLLVLQLAAYQALAQTQRLGIPPQPTFTLARNGAFHDVKAYCLDRHLRIGEPVMFKAVLAGDTQAVVRVGTRQPMSLNEAIRQNFISVQGAGIRNRRNYSQIDGTQLKFISKTDEPIEISFTQTVAMGESSLSPVNSASLSPIRESRSPAEFKTVQDQVWRTGIDESRLEALGYYGSGNVVRNSITNRNAIKAFQRNNGLPQTGVLNSGDIAALEKAEQETIKAFELLGFSHPRFDTEVPSVSDNVRAFEEFMGLPSTGKLTDSIRASLIQFAREYEPYIRQALFIDAPRFLQPDAVALKDTPNIITFQKGFFKTKDVVEVEKRNPLYITGVLFENPKGIEFWEIRNGGFVKRSTGEKAFSDFDEFSSEVAAVDFDKRTLTVRSGIYKTNGKVVLQLGKKNIELSQSEMKKFITGELKHPEIDAAIKNLPPDEAARPRLMVLRSPFSQGRSGDAGGGKALLNGFGYDQHDPLKLALAFEQHYGKNVDVFVASERELSFYNLQRIPKLEDGSQIGLYMDEKFKYSTDTVGPIKKDLRNAKMKVLKVGDDPASQTRIVIFANHNDEPFRQSVLKLAEEGRFRDSIIALAVCGGSGCEAQFNSLLISKSGARAVIFYNQEITGQAVQDVLLKFAELLRKDGAPNGNYHELWRMSVDEVIKTATRRERTELEKLREIIIQISAVGQKSSLDGE